jgi:hypothetical protein
MCTARLFCQRFSEKCKWHFLSIVLLMMGSITTIYTQQKAVGLFKLGADARFRHESIENCYLTDADPPGFRYSFERYRLRGWNTIIPSEKFEFNIRFTWEGRHYWMPASKDEWDKSDIVIDNLNAKINLQEIPLTLIAGRQDIVFGEGWLISDGTPLDGPRTTYFEAVRATVDMKKFLSTLDIIYVDQTSSPNRRISPIFSKNKPLMEQDERGVIVFVSNRSLNTSIVDGYLIYKNDKAVLPNGDDGEVYCFGGSISNKLNSSLSFRTEAAYQFGRRKNRVMFPNQDGSLTAWGQNSKILYNFCDEYRNQIFLVYEVTSGHDGNSSHNRQFDPLWGRWAKYSELFPNDLDRPSDRANFHRINFGYQIEPINNFSIQVNYHAFFAYANRFSGVAGFSETCKFKGHLSTILLKYQFSGNLSGLILGEYFIPGNYYNVPAVAGPLHTRNDPAAFFRIHLLYTVTSI